MFLFFVLSFSHLILCTTFFYLSLMVWMLAETMFNVCIFLCCSMFSFPFFCLTCGLPFSLSRLCFFRFNFSSSWLLVLFYICCVLFLRELKKHGECSFFPCFVWRILNHHVLHIWNEEKYEFWPIITFPPTAFVVHPSSTGRQHATEIQHKYAWTKAKKLKLKQWTSVLSIVNKREGTGERNDAWTKNIHNYADWDKN